MSPNFRTADQDGLVTLGPQLDKLLVGPHANLFTSLGTEVEHLPINGFRNTVFNQSLVVMNYNIDSTLSVGVFKLQQFPTELVNKNVE